MALSGEQVAIGLLLLYFTASPGKKAGRARALPPEWTDDEMFVFYNHVKGTLVPPEAALLVYTVESNLDPRATSGIAWGLPQMTGATLKDIGWTEPAANFAKLGVADQAPWIAKLLQYQSKSIGFVPDNALDLFVANLSPAAAARKSVTIYDGSVPAQAAAYKNNKGLDRAHKGYITRNDLTAVLTELETSETYTRALDQLGRVKHG